MELEYELDGKNLVWIEKKIGAFPLEANFRGWVHWILFYVV